MVERIARIVTTTMSSAKEKPKRFERKDAIFRFVNEYYKISYRNIPKVEEFL